MSLQRQQRRSSEVRGCLLRNFLDMRKHSLIRSESEDSGFSLESYEPFMSSSFDAEKFLQELGFAGDNAPLIPDRFIPSLIHRISNMPDETVMKLDNRVWNSIDSFKKKERTLWFFTQSSMECDLCINDLQRSYSLPAEFHQDPCDALCPSNGLYGMRNSSNSAFRVQNWLSRFSRDSLAAPDKTKANIAGISNQSSTESGILSALSDDEAYTGTSYTEGFSINDLYCSRKRVDDLEFPVSKGKPTAVMDFEERQTPETIPHSTPTCIVHDAETSVSTALCLETVPSSNYATSGTVCLTAACTSVPKRERCLEKSTDNENYFSFLNRTDTAEGYGRCKSGGENVTESLTEFVSSNRKLKQGDVNSVQTGVHSMTENLDSDTESVFLPTEASNRHYANGETGDSLQDFNISIRRASTPKTSDVTSFDYTMKRHSFDSAYLTADEKRKRFRQSHSKTHHVLFSKKDSRSSASCLHETISDDPVLCDSDILRNSHKETEVTQSDQVTPQKREHSVQDISHRHEGNLDTPSELPGMVSNVDISHSNGGSPDTPSEVSDSVRSADISHRNGGSPDTLSKVSDIVSNVDISLHNESNVDPPLELSDTVRNVDISRRSGGNLDIPLEVSHVANHVEQYEASTVPSRPGSESSEQYFSCDELSTTKTLVDGDFIQHDNDEDRKGISVQLANLFPCLPAEQRFAPEKMTSQLRDKTSFRNCNRSTYAKYKEHFILNKILKRNLKFSVTCPIEKMSRHFLLENDRTDNETFSQILNSNDTPRSSLKSSKVSEKHPRSVTYGKSALHGALLNFSTRKKHGSTLGDKVRELDNNQSIISKPFVRNLSLTSDMCSPKCEVRLINYDGSALFWAARNTAERSVSCDSGFPDSVNSNSDNTVNRRYINGVCMDVNSENEAGSTNNKVYFSEVRLEVNSEEGEREPEKESLKRCVAAQKFQAEEDTKEEVQDKDLSITKAPTNTENPCGRALRDLEDLRTAIRKAKETRMSASRELKLLQELLHNGGNEGEETAPGRTTLALRESKRLSLPNVEIINGNNGKGKTIEALSELQQKSANQASQNKEFWEEEIRKAKEEINQVCHEKLSIMEEKLRATEGELARALEENTRLKDQLELRSAAFPVCKCNAEAQQHSDFSHMNGIYEEDPKIISVVKPSVPTKNFWQEWDRLQSDLMKAERKADELNILLNQKLIELNRMQLTLSKQTKEMVLLEKAYFQLRSHLSKRKLNKSGLSHQSSSVAKTLSSTERASQTSSQTTDPEKPP